MTHYITDGKPVVLDTDIGEVRSHRFMEIPVVGPGTANRLVAITGIAVVDVDSIDETLSPFGIYIKTDYRLRDADEYLGIVNNNTDLIAATYVALAGIAADDSTEVVLGVDAVETRIDTNRRVQIHVTASLLGDATCNTVAYQANILIKRAK
jgi:hypothetical protein